MPPLPWIGSAITAATVSRRQQPLQDRRGCRGARPGDGVGGEQRVRVGAPHVQAGDAHRPLGPAVQPAVQVGALAAAGGQRGQQQRPLVGLAAAGAEEAAPQAGRGQLGDARASSSIGSVR